MFDIFLIFAQNIDCGYMSTHNLCFGAKIRKIGIPPAYPSFTRYIKVGFKGYSMHRHVYNPDEE